MDRSGLNRSWLRREAESGAVPLSHDFGVFRRKMLEQFGPDKCNAILQSFPDRVHEKPGLDETDYHNDNRDSLRPIKREFHNPQYTGRERSRLSGS
jgi:hypothetical protein